MHAAWQEAAGMELVKKLESMEQWGGKAVWLEVLPVVTKSASLLKSGIPFSESFDFSQEVRYFVPPSWIVKHLVNVSHGHRKPGKIKDILIFLKCNESKIIKCWKSHEIKFLD